MRATGIVRRIDDIGRVVIPREIRRSMNIQDGEPLEIYTDRDMVIFKKYKDFEVNYELMFNVVSAIYDVAGIYDNYGELKRVGSGFTLDVHIIASADKPIALANGLLIIPIVDSRGDLVAMVAVDDKHSADASIIQALAEATLLEGAAN